MAKQGVDVIVIGLGPGGEDLAGRLARAGWSVLGVDGHLVGGECPYYGCIPTKMMLHEARRPDARWDRVAERIRREATDGWDDRVAVERLLDAGARFVRGHAEVDGGPAAAPGPEGTAVTVTPVDGGAPQRWTARRAVVLNTGSESVVVSIPGLPEATTWTHRDVVTATELPGRLAVVGGGPLGCELAQALAGFGVQVTQLVRGPRLLGGEDPAAGELLADALRAEGVDVRISTQVSEVRAGAGQDGLTLVLDTGDEVTVDRVLLATGRRPRTAVAVDGYCRVLAGEAGEGVPVPGRYAVGDITGDGPFTHASMAQSAFVARRLLHGGGDGRGEGGSADGGAAGGGGVGSPGPEGVGGRGGGGRGGEGTETDPVFPARSVPRVTYTHPEVAAVGRSAGEDGSGDGPEAGLEGLRVARVDLAESTRGWIDEVRGSLTLVAGSPGTPEEGVLVGATVVGPRAGEVIGALTVAVHVRMPLVELDRVPWAYPTLHRAIRSAVSQLLG